MLPVPSSSMTNLHQWPFLWPSNKIVTIVLRVPVSENRLLALHWLICSALVLEQRTLLVMLDPNNVFADGLQMLMMMMLVGLQVLQLYSPCRHRPSSSPPRVLLQFLAHCLSIYRFIHSGVGALQLLGAGV